MAGAARPWLQPKCDLYGADSRVVASEYQAIQLARRRGLVDCSERQECQLCEVCKKTWGDVKDPRQVGHGTIAKRGSTESGGTPSPFAQSN
jgi:hypothetical protein